MKESRVPREKVSVGTSSNRVITRVLVFKTTLATHVEYKLLYSTVQYSTVQYSTVEVIRAMSYYYYCSYYSSTVHEMIGRVN